MSPGRKAMLPGSCPQWSSDHRELTRIGVIKKCTLTEIPTALLVTADAASTGLVRDVGPAIYLSFVHVKERFYENIFDGLHFEQIGVLASLLKTTWLHFRVSWARFVYN